MIGTVPHVWPADCFVFGAGQMSGREDPHDAFKIRGFASWPASAIDLVRCELSNNWQDIEQIEGATG